ncbi:MAG: glutamine-hydrolyzing carbamoyl-phosphate synthase small subunit [Ignavibacteria bacterium]|nr:glutamine-hydrolyzing carbamoyl-phosphate synthase small subunit [Ignavibacteria bacterium]
MKRSEQGSLLLADGSVYSGYSFGYPADSVGEVVFNTGMTGYPETLTDPSYNGQILILTYPLIGNYGIPPREFEHGLLRYFESTRIHVRGLIIADYSENYSHWNGIIALHEWLQAEKIPALYGIDTRQLTRKLREFGTMGGKILTGPCNTKEFSIPDVHFVKEVTTPKPIVHEVSDKRIILVDCGVKNNIIQAFLRRGISVMQVPYDYDFLSMEASGVVFSNGPGDPKSCPETIVNMQKAMEKGLPILGICLGSQIMGLAAGADTYKLKYGHRGHNQPVNESGSKRCYITSQNHGYAIDSTSLPIDWREWFINDNDGTNEGIMHLHKPYFGAQFHPEASPGPDDTEFIFDMFVRAIL